MDKDEAIVPKNFENITILPAKNGVVVTGDITKHIAHKDHYVFRTWETLTDHLARRMGRPQEETTI